MYKGIYMSRVLSTFICMCVTTRFLPIKCKGCTITQGAWGEMLYKRSMLMVSLKRTKCTLTCKRI